MLKPIPQDRRINKLKIYITNYPSLTHKTLFKVNHPDAKPLQCALFVLGNVDFTYLQLEADLGVDDYGRK